MLSTPWDVRVARLLVPPLRALGVRPNHVTSLGLAVGLGAALLYARGGPTAPSLGACLFLLTAVLDHADGELARATGQTSAFGHQFDRVADLIVKIGIFTGMGIGVADGPHGAWAILLGALGGASVVSIFVCRTRIAALRGTAALRQPSFAGFELEDVLYLVVAPFTWLGQVRSFLVCASVGAPLFAGWFYRQYRLARRPLPQARCGSRPASRHVAEPSRSEASAAPAERYTSSPGPPGH